MADGHPDFTWRERGAWADATLTMARMMPTEDVRALTQALLDLILIRESKPNG